MIDELLARIEQLESRVEVLEKRKRSVMTRPTVEEIAAYCDDRKNGIDAQEFFDHHERVGWKVGRNQSPMKCWQAAVRTWEGTKKREEKAAGRGNGQERSREELLMALKDSSNTAMPQLSVPAKQLFFSLKTKWKDLQATTQAGIVPF